MSRTLVREAPGRAVVAADSAFPANQPAAPMTTLYTETNPLPAGIFRTEGAPVLIVDIAQGSSSTANTYNVLSWNGTAGAWFSTLVINVASGAQNIRTSIPNWASNYAFVAVAGSTVNATLYVFSAESLTG